MLNNSRESVSAFKDAGFRASVERLIDEIADIYRSDQIPWVVGYSGGKDSTATLQLIWMALSRLGANERHKAVHVISTDTLVENPVVASWVSKSLEQIKSEASMQGLPIFSHRLTPKTSDTFWVNLIGRGYPAPKTKFRWCTERLKIKPSNEFIKNVVKESGEAIVVLGTRRAESATRARSMDKISRNRTRDKLSVRPNLINSLVYSPIEHWSNDDVWLFLMQVPNPWNFNNKDLLTMYKGASADGECPLVVDSTTPSCGDSRFGCWVCTVVEKDKSMSAMVQNDDEKHWMKPLLELRNELDPRDDMGNRNDRHLRDFRRTNGSVSLHNDTNVPGPYTQESREAWLRKILTVQKWIRENGPEGVRDIELITMPELKEIRRIWVIDKHEIEDTLPQIYQEVNGESFEDGVLDDNLPFAQEEMDLLKESCGEDRLLYELTRELIDIERRYKTATKRSGLYGAIEKAFRRNFYESAEDALKRAIRRRDIQASVESVKTSLVQDMALSQPKLVDANNNHPLGNSEERVETAK
jgi:DNA sulfur modification protein DndC